MMAKNILISLSALSLVFSAACAGALEIGKVTAVEGRVDVVHLPDNEAVMLTYGAQVFTGDFIRTKDHSKAEIAFADKSTVKIAPNTRIEIKDFKVKGGSRESAEIYVSRGKIIADVSKTGSPDTFIITTPNAKGSVKGTEMVFIYQADTTSALVKDGRLSLCNISLPDQKKEIADGEATMVVFDAPPKDPRSYMDAEFALHEKDAKPASFQAVSLGKDTARMKGVITSLAGGVRVLKKGAPDWHYVKLNEVLEEGDKIETAEDGRVSILFENGNILDLQDNSRVLFATLRKDPKTGEFDNTFESDKGRIKAVVEKLGKKSVFRVNTPTALCGVRGTVMYLNIAADTTQAFYEGGGGIVTNPISGNTAFVESGQNTMSMSTGMVSAPITTPVETMMTLDASYSYGVVQDSYALPGNAAGSTGEVSVPGGAISGIAADLDTGTGGGGFNPPMDLVPITEITPQQPPPPPPQYAESLSFAGSMGYVDASSEFQPQSSPANPVNGLFSIAEAGNSEWITTGKGSVSGNISINSGVPDTFAFWTSDNVICSTPNNGQYRGFLGATISTSSFPPSATLWGKALFLYRDPSGWAGTMTFSFGGEYAVLTKFFHSELARSGDVIFTARQFVGPNFDLNAQSLFTGSIYGRGSGNFYNVSGLPTGSITCGANYPVIGLSGTEFDIDSDWGIFQLYAQGTYDATGTVPPPSLPPYWTLALGGNAVGDAGHPTYWMGTVNGDMWDVGVGPSYTNQATGDFKGVFLWVKNDTGGVNDTFEGGSVLNGNMAVHADPLAVPDKTWQAIGGGEVWVATKSFTQAELGFSASQLSNFVNVPISQVKASIANNIVGQSGGFTTFTMDARVYQSAGFVPGAPFCWTGTIAGTFSASAPPDPAWFVQVTGTLPDPSSISLSGVTWDISQKIWSATVVSGSTIGSRTIQAGQAGGNMIIDGDNSEFEGVAAGTAS